MGSEASRSRRPRQAIPRPFGASPRRFQGWHRERAPVIDRAMGPRRREYAGQLRMLYTYPGVEPPRRKEENVGISYVEFEDEAGIRVATAST